MSKPSLWLDRPPGESSAYSANISTTVADCRSQTQRSADELVRHANDGDDPEKMEISLAHALHVMGDLTTIQLSLSYMSKLVFTTLRTAGSRTSTNTTAAQRRAMAAEECATAGLETLSAALIERLSKSSLVGHHLTVAVFEWCINLLSDASSSSQIDVAQCQGLALIVNIMHTAVTQLQSVDTPLCFELLFRHARVGAQYDWILKSVVERLASSTESTWRALLWRGVHSVHTHLTSTLPHWHAQAHNVNMAQMAQMEAAFDRSLLVLASTVAHLRSSSTEGAAEAIGHLIEAGVSAAWQTPPSSTPANEQVAVLHFLYKLSSLSDDITQVIALESVPYLSLHNLCNVTAHLSLVPPKSLLSNRQIQGFGIENMIGAIKVDTMAKLYPQLIKIAFDKVRSTDASVTDFAVHVQSTIRAMLTLHLDTMIMVINARPTCTPFGIVPITNRSVKGNPALAQLVFNVFYPNIHSHVDVALDLTNKAASQHAHRILCITTLAVGDECAAKIIARILVRTALNSSQSTRDTQLMCLATFMRSVRPWMPNVMNAFVNGMSQAFQSQVNTIDGKNGDELWINFLKNLLRVVEMEKFAQSSKEEQRDDVNAIRYIGLSDAISKSYSSFITSLLQSVSNSTSSPWPSSPSSDTKTTIMNVVNAASMPTQAMSSKHLHTITECVVEIYKDCLRSASDVTTLLNKVHIFTQNLYAHESTDVACVYGIHRLINFALHSTNSPFLPSNTPAPPSSKRAKTMLEEHAETLIADWTMIGRENDENEDDTDMTMKHRIKPVSALLGGREQQLVNQGQLRRTRPLHTEVVVKPPNAHNHARFVDIIHRLLLRVGVPVVGRVEGAAESLSSVLCDTNALILERRADKEWTVERDSMLHYYVQIDTQMRRLTDVLLPMFEILAHGSPASIRYLLPVYRAQLVCMLEHCAQKRYVTGEGVKLPVDQGTLVILNNMLGILYQCNVIPEDLARLSSLAPHLPRQQLARPLVDLYNHLLRYADDAATKDAFDVRRDMSETWTACVENITSVPPEIVAGLFTKMFQNVQIS